VKATEAGVQPDVISYNTLISAYSKEDMPQLAHIWLNRMERKNITPSIVSFTTLMQSYSRKRMAQEVEALHSEMRRRRLQLNAKHLVALILAYPKLEPQSIQAVSNAFRRWVSHKGPLNKWVIQAMRYTAGGPKCDDLFQELGIQVSELEKQDSDSPADKRSHA